MKFSRATFLIFCLVATQCLAFAQNRRATTQFESAPFDTSVEKLPPRYIGHSLAPLMQILSKWKRIAQKSEFETTADYQARLIKEKQKPLSGALRFNSLLAFSVSGEDEQLTAKYDADLGIMTVTLKLKRDYAASSSDNPYYRLVWGESSRRLGGYVGRNAFNRAARVQVYRNDEFLIGVPAADLEDFTEFRTRDDLYIRSKLYEPEKSVDLTLHMGANEARAVKPNLRVLVIGRLADNPYYYDFGRDTPEIDDPYDRYEHTYMVKIVPQEFWVYDLASGTIYTRITPSTDSSPQPQVANSALPYDRFGDPRASRATNATGRDVDHSRTFSPKEVNVKARILSRPEPTYPEEDRKNQVSGTVVLRAVFGSDGKVTDIRVVSGLTDAINARAIEAAKQIRFTPAMKDGRAVSQYIQIEYNFNLY